MSVREWLEERKSAGVKLGLENCELLLQRLDNPHLNFPSVHVAGTNGKGSLCVQLSALAAANGLRVGLFSTPHLVIVEERARIDGQPISVEKFDEYLTQVRSASEILPSCSPTYYEATFIVAMLAFAESGIERAIIETGLGGRLDATRLVDADLTVITTISLDHTELLGDTLAQIAAEKAAIHRDGVPLIALEPNDKSVLPVFAEYAGDDLWLHSPSVNLPPWEIWSELSQKIAHSFGWGNQQYNAIWPGRSPNWPPNWFEAEVTISAAHNSESIDAELALLANSENSQQKLILVLGMSQKSNLLTALGDLPNPQNFKSWFSHVFFTEPTSGRNSAVLAEDLRDIFPVDFGESYSIEKEPGLAVEMAANLAAEQGTSVIVMGSVYLVGDILKYVVESSDLNLWKELTVH